MRLLLHSLGLLSTLHSREVPSTILNVKLNINLAIQLSTLVIQGPGLNAGHIRHDLKLGVNSRAAGRAEEVLVDLAASTLGVVGGACSYSV